MNTLLKQHGLTPGNERSMEAMQEFLAMKIGDFVNKHPEDLYFPERLPLPRPDGVTALRAQLEEYKGAGNAQLGAGDVGFGTEKAIAYYMVAVEYYDAFKTVAEGAGAADRAAIDTLMAVICTNAALCLANAMEIDRSFEMANRAIEFNPNNPKAHFRRGYCLQKFVEFEESNREFKLAMDCCKGDKPLYEMIEKEYRLQEVKIEKMLEEKENIKTRIENDTQFQEFDVDLKWIPGEGRCIVAKKDIPACTPLLRVAPFAHALDDDCEKRFCGACARPVKGVEHTTCPECKRTVFCFHCRDDKVIKAQHKEECDVLQFLSKNFANAESRDFRFMARIVLSAKRSKEGIYSKENAPGTWKAKPFIFDSYQDLLNLSRNQNQITTRQMNAFKRGVESIFSLFQLVKGPEYLSSISREDILHAYSIIQLNGHEILHPLHDSCGFGIYPTASYLNHSCSPNACWYFDENGMITISNLRDIKAGEEITITYVDTTYPLASRRKDLLETYHFFCKCDKCEAERRGPVGFLCQKCRTPVKYSSMRYDIPELRHIKDTSVSKEKKLMVATGKLYTCESCQTHYDPQIFDIGITNLKYMVTKHPELVERLYGRFSPHFSEAYHSIRSLARENNDIDAAIHWTRKILDNYEGVGGVHPWSTLGTYYYLLRYLKKQNKPETIPERMKIAETIKTNIQRLIKLDDNYFFTPRVLHKLKISD